MKWLACIIVAIALIAPVARSAPTEARVHVQSALDALGLAEKDAEDIAKALLLSQREIREAKEWGVAQQQRADKAESFWGYVWGKRIERILFWGAIGIVLLYVTPIILRLIGLVATGPYGAIASTIGTVVGGALPGGGYVNSVADNLWFRRVKPQAEEYATLKAGALK
jgi:hypothetical protein